MARFGRKKGDDSGEAATSDAPVAFSSEKAESFFKHARTVYDSGNYPYAMTLYLNGLGQDPTSMDGLKGFLAASDRYLADAGKKASTKEAGAGVNKRGGLVDKYTQALLVFGIKKDDPAVAIKVASAAGDLGLRDAGKFLGTYALRLALADPKTKKDWLVKLLDLFEKVEAFDLAAQTGEEATRLDPGDGALQARLRNMLAQSTMSSGGFDNTEEGGFRKNIRDADKQAALEQSDQLSKSDSARSLQVERAEADYKSRPDDMASLNVYAKALLERAGKGDELRAMSLYNDAYKKTKQFRFRQQAGEIQLRLARRNVAILEKRVAANPDDAESAAKLESAREMLGKLEMNELSLQVENYPTDLGLKYKLGVAYFNQEKYNEAIEQFQQAQDDAKNKANVLNYMGQSFMKLGGWDDAAIETFRAASEIVFDVSSELGMELRYYLMAALQSKATNDRDLELAEEADKLAAGIAIKQFNYRDVRERREQIKALIGELKG